MPHSALRMTSLKLHVDLQTFQIEQAVAVTPSKFQEAPFLLQDSIEGRCDDICDCDVL